MIWRKHRVRGRVVWLTGASSGIGRALAVELAKRGAQLALSSRSANALEALARSLHTSTLVVPFDVTSREQTLQATNHVVEHFKGIDVAIFNAGTSEYLDLDKFDSSVFERMMQVNFFSIIYGIEAVLPWLKKSNTPHLVGMSSTAAYGGLPLGEAYGASKAAARYALEGLRVHWRMRGDNLPVSTICPGFVRTPLTDKNEFPMPMRIEADKAAHIIANGIERQQEEIHFPLPFSLSLKLISSLPSPIYTRLLSWALKSRT